MMYTLTQLEQLLQAMGIAKGYYAAQPYFYRVAQLTATVLQADDGHACNERQVAYVLTSAPVWEAVVLHFTANSVNGWYLTPQRDMAAVMSLYEVYPQLQLTLQSIERNASFSVVFTECLVQLLQQGQVGIIDVQHSLRQHALLLLNQQPQHVAAFKKLWKYLQLQRLPNNWYAKEAVYAYEPSLIEATADLREVALWQWVTHPEQVEQYCQRYAQNLQQWYHRLTGLRLLYLVYESTYAPLGQLFTQALGFNSHYVLASSILLGLGYSASLGYLALGQTFILQLLSYSSLPYRLDDTKASVKLSTMLFVRLSLLALTLVLAYYQQAPELLYSLVAGLIGSSLLARAALTDKIPTLEQQALRQFLSLLGWQLGQSGMNSIQTYWQDTKACEAAKTTLTQHLETEGHAVSQSRCWTPLLWGKPRLSLTYASRFAQAVNLDCTVESHQAECEVVSAYSLLPSV